jgi:dTDP-4-dehydrorhamnose reductase
MTILVAGKSGQLADALMQVALQRGVSLVALGRQQMNIEDAGSIRAAVTGFRPSLLVNAAAYTAVDQAEAEPERALALNRDGAARMAAAATEFAVGYIHVSTDYVFDGHKTSPYIEDDAPSPLSAYGRSKLAGEQAVRDACAWALTLRTSWLYHSRGHNFVRTMLRLGGTRDVIRVVNDQHGTPTAATDLAGAILDIAGQLRTSDRRRGVYHLAAAGETTWFGFATAIFREWAKHGQGVPKLVPIPTAEYPTPARRPANSCLDCAKIARDFGVRLPHWENPLSSCIDELAMVAEETFQ